MRVLFTLLPATGSLHPLVPLARALIDAGHEVRFACAPSFQPEVRAHGFDTSPAGIDFLFSQPDYFAVLLAHAGVAMPDMAALTGHARHAWVTENLFIAAAANRMLPDVLALARTWRPHLIVRESSEFSGCVAAEALGIPHASVAAAADAALDRRELTATALEPLRASAGLPADASAEMIYRHLHLSFMPRRFFGPEARFPAATHFVRHVHAQRAEPVLPHWWQHRPARPTVLVSLGTIFFRTPGLYDTLIDALRSEPVTVAVAIGHEDHQAVAAPPAPNVHVKPTLPIAALLSECDIFVTHGGFNSVKEAVSAATPMLVVPIASDQHYSADRVEALELGRVVRPDRRTPEHVRDQVRAVLGDPRYGAAATALAADMAALPPVEHAVGLLERLI